MIEAGAPSPPASRWAAWLVPALLVVLPFVWFWRATTGEVLLAANDALAIFFPMRRMFAEQIAAGVWPLWNPRVFGGMPFFAAMQTSMLYPPTWLFLVLPPVAAMNLLVIGHFAGTALAVYGYARTIGCRPAAAGFSGLVFAFGGFVSAHMGNLPLFQGLPWMPVLLIALERLRHRARLRDGLLGTAAVALALLTGHPHIPAYTLMVAALYVGFFTFFDLPATGRPRYAGSAALAVAAGVALAAVQLVPGAEVAVQSARPGLSYDDFVSFALPMRQLPMLLFPFLFGGGPGVPYWGDWLLLELTGSPGIVPLMLAGAALAGVRSDPLIRFWFVLALWSLLLALGGDLPLAHLMYHVPVYNLFRAPVRNLAVFSLAIAVLGGIALDRLPARRWRCALAASALVMLSVMVAVAAIAVAAGVRLWGDLAADNPLGPRDAALQASLSIRGAALALPLSVALAGAALACALAIRSWRWPIAALVAVAAFELALQARSLPLAFAHPERAVAPPAYARFLTTAAPGDGVARSVFGVPGGGGTLKLLPASWGVPMINGNDSIPLVRYTQLAGGMHYWGVIPEAALSGPARFLDLLNARYLVLDFRRNRRYAFSVDGIDLPREPLALLLRPGDTVEMTLPIPVAASAVAAVTSIGDSLQISQDTPVLRIELIGADGSAEPVWWRAGVQTAEWAWDRADVRPVVPHAKARVVETLSGGGHRYFGVSSVARPLEVSRVRITYVAPTGALDLWRISLYDAASGRSHPLTLFHCVLAAGQRWRTVFHDRSTVVLEKQRALPRAWLVSATQQLDASAVLRTIETGVLPDGRAFDPAAVALVEEGPQQDLGAVDPAARVVMVEYTPTRIVLQAHSAAPAFLVLSEVFFPGWRASVDGSPVPIRRTDYVLRGLALPAGTHRVELVYRPRSVRVGAAISALALVVLAAVALARRLQARRNPRRGVTTL
jgi:hypothetical protein